MTDAPHISRCDSSSLRSLLDGSLDASTEETLASHLDQCEACQKTLEELLSDPKTVSLRVSSEASSERLQHVIEQLESHSLEAAPMAEVTLDFLEPSDDPDCLGTLDEYKVVEVIGRGGMGIVLRAFDARLSRFVAIKALSPQLVSSELARLRFQREGRAAAAVRHDHVVAIHAVDETGELPYLVMEYIEGSSLQEKIAREAPLPTEEILRIGSQTAAGLAAAHDQGLVHRDIKPANILLENSVERVHITDFGLARATDDTSITRANVAAGTPQYMSPEQTHGANVDHRSDLFSFGCVLYEMASSCSPFKADSTAATIRNVCEATPLPITDFNSEVPAPLVDLIERLLNKDPDLRPQTASELQVELEHYLAAKQRLPSAPLVPLKSRPTSTHKDKTMGNNTLITILLTVAAVFFVLFATAAIAVGVYLATSKQPPKLSFEREFALSVQAGRDKLDEGTRRELESLRHPLLFQISDPNTKPLLDQFGGLSNEMHAELLQKNYLKWKYADLSPEIQAGYRNAVQNTIDMTKQMGQPADPTLSVEALETAVVGFAVVSLDPSTKVVSWFILFSNRPAPLWVTIVGGSAAGTPAYFQAHNTNLQHLRVLPDSALP
ncbi:MAG: serine/threonine protein kinase [Planctomycetes bacterium]|nr:serine/threonine protein kinase [Planctomycetota bacterium]